MDESDWVIVRGYETNQSPGAGYTSWREKIRNFVPGAGIPTSLPPIPGVLQNDPDIIELYAKFDRVREINMINDPLVGVGT